MALDLYEIGVNLVLDDGINAGVDQLIAKFDTLQAAIDKINEGLGRSSTAVDEVARASAGMATAWGEAADAAERMATASERVRTPGVGGGGDDDDQPGRPGSGGGTSHISPWDYILAGGMAVGAGKAVVEGSFEQAASIQHQGVLMQDQGASHADVQTAINAAQGLQQQMPGLSQEDALTIIRDTYSQSVRKDGSRDMGEAVTVASNLAQTAYVLQGLGDDDAAAQMFGLLRAGDLRGLMNKRNTDGSVDFKPMEQFIAAYQTIAQASGGRIAPQDMLSIMKNAGPEGLMMDPHALETAALLSQNLGPSQVGTGLNALAIQFLGGKMSQGAADNLYRAGLLPTEAVNPHTGKLEDMFVDGKITKDFKNGLGQVLIPNGALKNEAEFQEDPFKWIQDTFEPAIAKMDKGSQTELLSSIYADLSRIPGARVVAETLFQAGYLSRQEAGLGSIPGGSQSLSNVKGDPTNQAGGVMNALDAFGAQLGADALPTTSAQLNDVTAALNKLTDWARENKSLGSDLAMTGQTVAELGAGGVLYGITRIIGKMVGGGVAGAAAGEGAALAGAEGVAAASGPPGWVVAAAAAVALELVNTGVASKIFADIEAGSSPIGAGWARGATRFGNQPSGKPGDPIHVKVVAAPAGTNMPTSPTGHLPAQSMPMPGQASHY